MRLISRHPLHDFSSLTGHKAVPPHQNRKDEITWRFDKNTCVHRSRIVCFHLDRLVFLRSRTGLILRWMFASSLIAVLPRLPSAAWDSPCAPDGPLASTLVSFTWVWFVASSASDDEHLAPMIATMTNGPRTDHNVFTVPWDTRIIFFLNFRLFRL